MSGSPALSASITHEAKQAGFGKGELQGMITNLGSVSRMIAPVVWGQVYAYSSQRGMPGAFFAVATVGTLSQFAMAVCGLGGREGGRRGLSKAGVIESP